MGCNTYIIESDGNDYETVNREGAGRGHSRYRTRAS